MTDLLAPLNDDQRFFIRCIGEPFLMHQQWPLFDYVEAELDKQGLDARQMLDSLPEAGQQQFPNMSPPTIKTLGQFLPHEAATWRGASNPAADGQWSIELSRELLQYREVKTSRG